jgi:hypothetical protein
MDILLLVHGVFMTKKNLLYVKVGNVIEMLYMHLLFWQKWISREFYQMNYQMKLSKHGILNKKFKILILIRIMAGYAQ